jgi:hypothetical protein
MMCYFDGFETVLEGLVKVCGNGGDRVLTCLRHLRYLTGLSQACGANVLDRLEELEAMFEGLGDALTGKTGKV